MLSSFISFQVDGPAEGVIGSWLFNVAMGENRNEKNIIGKGWKRLKRSPQNENEERLVDCE